MLSKLINLLLDLIHSSRAERGGTIADEVCNVHIYFNKLFYQLLIAADFINSIACVVYQVGH